LFFVQEIFYEDTERTGDVWNLILATSILGTNTSTLIWQENISDKKKLTIPQNAENHNYMV
jgi:hypothetical protein